MSRRPSLQILHRYRNHLLQQEQIILQEKLAEERLLQNSLHLLDLNVKATHAAKLNSSAVAELVQHDQSANWLHVRKIQINRSLSLARLSREEAMEKTLKAKRSRDQIGLILEKARRMEIQEFDVKERNQLDDISTSRHTLITREYAS